MQIRKDIPSKMYHYTSLESLCSIVENQEFWLGDTRQMNDELVPLELSGCDIVPDLNGYTFETLPKALQIKLKRSFVRMEVIKKESESSLKYHMFKRLNTS